MGFPNRTRPALRCWRTPARISKCIFRRRSIRRSSITSRWGFIIPRRSSRTRSAAACGFIRSTCRCRTGTCTVEADGAIRLGLRYVSAAFARHVGQAIASHRPTGHHHQSPVPSHQPPATSHWLRALAILLSTAHRAHRLAPRRSRHACRHRRAQHVRVRSSFGAVAGRAAVRPQVSCSQHDDQRRDRRARRVFRPGVLADSATQSCARPACPSLQPPAPVRVRCGR